MGARTRRIGNTGGGVFERLIEEEYKKARRLALSDVKTEVAGFKLTVARLNKEAKEHISSIGRLEKELESATTGRATTAGKLNEYKKSLELAFIRLKRWESKVKSIGERTLKSVVGGPFDENWTEVGIEANKAMRKVKSLSVPFKNLGKVRDRSYLR